jgi:hypothetical protein
VCRYCEDFDDLSVVLTGEFHEQQQPEVINPFENGYREEEREVEGGTHAYHVTYQGSYGTRGATKPQTISRQSPAVSWNFKFQISSQQQQQQQHISCIDIYTLLYAW